MDVLRFIQCGRLCFDFVLQVSCVLDGIFEIDSAVFVFVYAYGKDIEVGILRLHPGININSLHVALDGVAAIKSSNANFVISRDSVDFLAVIKDISFRLACRYLCERSVGWPPRAEDQNRTLAVQKHICDLTSVSMKVGCTTE